MKAATAGGTAARTLPPPLPSYIEELSPERGRQLPFKVEGLHLDLVETDDGTEFHVVGRGDPVATLSHSTAIAELERRLTDSERDLIEGTRYSVRDIVASSTWDRMHGWGAADAPDDQGEQMHEQHTDDAEGREHDEPTTPLEAPGEYWTKERCIEALKADVQRRGDIPFQSDWAGASTEERPNAAIPVKHFGSWGDFVVAAGFERPRRGRARLTAVPDPVEPPAQEPPAAETDDDLPEALRTPVIEIAPYVDQVREMEGIAAELDEKVAAHSKLGAEIDELHEQLRQAAARLAA